MKILSVIILSKNNGRTLGYTLLSVLRAAVPEGWGREIIVVDARSSDNTPRILEAFKKYIRVIYDEGRGIGIARNLGVSSAKGEIICFVDADCVVGRDHFVRIVNAVEEGGAELIDVKGGKGPAETPVEELEQRVWEWGRAYSSELTRDRCFAGGSFISFKRDVFERIGGFWEHPPYGADDLDFSYRAYRSGFKISVVPSPGSYCRHRRNLLDLVKQQVGWGRGYAHLMVKYRSHYDFWKCYRWSTLVYKLFGESIHLYPIFACVLAPIKGLYLAVRSRDWRLIPYWTLRRWAFLYGMLRELGARRARRIAS